MDYLIICSVSLLAAMLTLFSGFGLGTLLLPAFALFFPTEIAVAMTAMVHLANNLFKLALLGKYADKSVVLRFGLPAILSAYFGARMLLWLADLPPLAEYHLFSATLAVTPVNLAIGILMMFFALLEIVPAERSFTLSRRFLPLGGVLSGFFGGLSGHQGALRTVFLLRAGLSKEAFIATGVVIACIIDVSRIFVYSERFAMRHLEGNAGLLAAAIATAFLGAYAGSKLMKKVTLRGVQLLVSVMLFVLALGLIAGVI